MYKWWKDEQSRIEIGAKISAKLLGKKKPRNFNTIFKNQFIIRRRTRCWIFTGKLNIKGYGYKRYMGKTFGAHRLSYELTYGKINNPNLFVCHRCDNPSCINPDHLWLGTNHENMIDMMHKGRGRISKLTHEDKETIKRLFLEGKTRMELKYLYDVSINIINFIIDNYDQNITHLK